MYSYILFRYLGKFDVFGNEEQLFNQVRDSFDLVGFNMEVLMINKSK